VHSLDVMLTIVGNYCGLWYLQDIFALSTYLDLGEPSAGGKNVLVYEFKIGDTDEPDLIANMVIADWLEHNRIGCWILDNKISLNTRIVTKMSMFNPMVEVYATLTDQQQTEYYLIK